MDGDGSTLPNSERDPTQDDLISICRELNRAGARYLIVGGFAIMRHGYPRMTEDLDILLEESLENQKRVLSALEILPNKSARELQGDDLRDYIVVRIADEFLVDLMTQTCGVSFAEAEPEIVWHEEDGVRIPYASPKLMWRMKQTVREKDELDRLFLSKQFGFTRVAPPPTEKPADSWWLRIWRKIRRTH
jgi:hypothetical protein